METLVKSEGRLYFVNTMVFINHRILNSSLASAFVGTLVGILAGYPSQPTFTCSKLTIETLEQSVKYVLKTPERRQ